jgi:hypothetical protein
MCVRIHESLSSFLDRELSFSHVREGGHLGEANVIDLLQVLLKKSIDFVCSRARFCVPMCSDLGEMNLFGRNRIDPPLQENEIFPVNLAKTLSEDR